VKCRYSNVDFEIESEVALNWPESEQFISHIYLFISVVSALEMRKAKVFAG
jgi:hypothetical protein